MESKVIFCGSPFVPFEQKIPLLSVCHEKKTARSSQHCSLLKIIHNKGVADINVPNENYTHSRFNNFSTHLI